MFNSVDPDTVLVEVEDTGPVLRICGLGSPGVLPGDISAPEILSAGSSAAAPDAKSDMWAFGALLYRAHVGRCPVAVPGKPGVDTQSCPELVSLDYAWNGSGVATLSGDNAHGE